jgi:hypothetical protein
MAKSEATVEELVGMIERGDLVLPEMQRRYIWRSSRVRDLLDSLYRGYPSGAILLWETDEDIPLQDMAIEQQKSPYTARRLLLDGQQRLTALSAVIRGKPVCVRGRKRPIELLFNLEHPDDLADVTEVNEDGDDDEEEEEDTVLDDEAPDSTEDELMQRFNRMVFVVSAKKLAQMPQWVNVSEVFRLDEDAPFLQRAGVRDFSDPRYTKYSKRLARLRAIRKYVYKYDVLERALSYNEVTEIFVRVNSYGAKLRSSDLALAQITAKWRGSLKIFQAFQSQCSRAGFDFVLGTYLRNLVSFATGQCRFLTVGNLSVEKLKTAWEESKEGMEFALNFLKSNCGIECEELLSSPYLVIALGYYGYKRKYKIKAAEVRRLRTWLLTANAKGHFSRGSSETLLDQDLATLRDGGDAEGLLDRLTLQVGRLDITPEELEGRSQRSGLFKTMFLAFRAAGARDWFTNLAIALDHSGIQHRLQFHHIFPKGLLKKLFTSREADDIANLAFISGKSNRDISDKPPAEYFPGAVRAAGEESFAAQCIPVDPELLALDQYKTFLAERRKLISTRLNEFLSKDS